MTKFADAIVAHFRPRPPEKRPCNLCGRHAVLWPYGKDGEDICIPCAAEDLDQITYSFGLIPFSAALAVISPMIRSGGRWSSARTLVDAA